MTSTPFTRRARHLGALVGRELARMLATLLVASIVVFLLLHLFPGDPAAAVVSGGQRIPTPEQIAETRHRLRLDRPLVEQYVRWLTDAVRGDLGDSWLSRQTVTERISERIGATLLLGSVTLGAGMVLTFVLGARAAIAPFRFADIASRAIATLGTAVPSFVLGLVAIRFLAVEFGIGTIITDGTMGTILLPALVGSIGLAAYWVRPFRAAVADALASEWAVTGQARGWSTARLLVGHAIPNACVAFLPFLGFGLAGIVAGSILVENVFGWPGLGPLVIESIKRRDLPIVQGFALLSTVAYVLSTRIVDLASRLTDPTRSLSRRAEEWA